MEKVTIQIDSRWVRRVKSPLMWIVAALQGVSITFAPLFLYSSGKGISNSSLNWIAAGLCFGSIFLVGVFYISLGNDVVRELRKQDAPATN